MHVAQEIGFWGDPKVLLLARTLRSSLGDAGMFILRWREFVLLRGDEKGRVHGYTFAEVAASVGFEGKAPVLWKAMKLADLVGQRGRVLVYPNWSKTPTGRYAEIRAEDRERKKKARQRAMEGGGSGGDDETPSADVRRTAADVHQTSEVSKKGRPADAAGSPPEAPPEGGGEGVASLWEWAMKTHPRPRDPSTCKRLLAQLTPDDIAHLRYALPIQARSTGWKKNLRYVPTLPKYLREHGWLEIRWPPETKEAADGAPKPKAEPTPEELAKRAAAEADRERQRQTFERLAAVKERLRAAGLRGEELELRAAAEFEREINAEAAA